MLSAQAISDIEEIKTLKARYFRYMDTKHFDGWKTDVFVADAVMDVAEVPGQNNPEGVDAIIDFVSTILEGATTVHHGHMPEIEILSTDSAKGIWALYDMLLWPEPNKHGWNSLHGAGHYHETYVKTAEGWRIKTLKLTRLWLQRT